MQCISIFSTTQAADSLSWKHGSHHALWCRRSEESRAYCALVQCLDENKPHHPHTRNHITPSPHTTLHYPRLAPSRLQYHCSSSPSFVSTPYHIVSYRIAETRQGCVDSKTNRTGLQRPLNITSCNAFTCLTVQQRSHSYS